MSRHCRPWPPAFPGAFPRTPPRIRRRHTPRVLNCLLPLPPALQGEAPPVMRVAGRRKSRGGRFRVRACGFRARCERWRWRCWRGELRGTAQRCARGGRCTNADGGSEAGAHMGVGMAEALGSELGSGVGSGLVAALPSLPRSTSPFRSSSLPPVPLPGEWHGRVGVAVISVGNITWGGNGKTPMVASTALHLLSLLNTAPHSQPASQPAMSATTTIPTSSSPTPTTPPSPTTANTSPSNSSSPTPPPHAPSILILSRGYAGGDEARMLQRQLSGHPVIIAVGRKRADVARRVIGQFGAWRGWGQGAAEGGKHEGRKEEGRKEEVVGHGGVDGGGGAVGPVAAVIMDDGMQHWALHRDLDIVMLNAVPPHAQGQEQIQAQADSYAQGQSGCSSPWGNGKLVPRGPMRERLEALQRADVVVIHNADLAPPAYHPFTCSPPTPASPAGPASPACHEPRGSTALKGAQGRGNSHLLLCHREGGAGEGGGEEGEAGGGDRVVACASVAGRDAVCLSAIGSPDALQATLQTQLHLRRVVSIALPDHSPFSLQVSCSHSPAKPATTATCPCACMHACMAMVLRHATNWHSFPSTNSCEFPFPLPARCPPVTSRAGGGRSAASPRPPLTHT
ncbi:unnamed protein product [Closterium sp. Naga37s-1]|nr:unnamed protein product [Closterium sp. Naga37s-1]